MTQDEVYAKFATIVDAETTRDPRWFQWLRVLEETGEPMRQRMDRVREHYGLGSIASAMPDVGVHPTRDDRAMRAWFEECLRLRPPPYNWQTDGE